MIRKTGQRIVILSILFFLIAIGISGAAKLQIYGSISTTINIIQPEPLNSGTEENTNSENPEPFGSGLYDYNSQDPGQGAQNE